MFRLRMDLVIKWMNRSWFVVLCVAAPIFLYTVFKGTPGKIITSDGNGYYAWLTTLAADGDVHFYNDLLNLYSPDSIEWIEKAGEKVVNQYPPGLAVVMSPGFLLAHGIAKLFAVSGLSNINPYDPFYKIVTASWLLFFYLFGVYGFQRLVEHFTQSKIFSGLFTIFCVLSTGLIHYIAKEPAMSHGAVFTISTFATVLFLAPREKPFSLKRWACIGALVGLLLAVRNSTVVLLPWWVLLGWRAAERNWNSRLKAATYTGVAAGIVFSIQPLMLSLMMGHFSLNGYPSYGMSSGFEGIWKGLFSSRHGLFAYHPVWLIMIAALCVGLRVKQLRPFAIAALLVFLGSVGINGTWDCWWFGDAFGNRGYLDVIVPCASVAGAAVYCNRNKVNNMAAWVLPISLAVLLVGSNFILWLGYLLRRYPADGMHTYAEAWLWWLK